MRVTRIERSWIEGSQVSGCDKEGSSVFGFEGMGVNVQALIPVKYKHVTSENTKA